MIGYNANIIKHPVCRCCHTGCENLKVFGKYEVIKENSRSIRTGIVGEYVFQSCKVVLSDMSSESEKSSQQGSGALTGGSSSGAGSVTSPSPVDSEKSTFLETMLTASVGKIILTARPS